MALLVLQFELAPQQRAGCDTLQGVPDVPFLLLFLEPVPYCCSSSNPKPGARIDCASSLRGWPIFGDIPIYGERADLPLQLLARKVIVPLSKSKPPVEAEAPAPPHMLETLAACGFEGDAL